MFTILLGYKFKTIFVNTQSLLKGQCHKNFVLIETVGV